MSVLAALAAAGIAAVSPLPGMVTLPVEFEWSSNKTWQEAAIVDDVLVVSGYRPRRGQILAYALPTLKKLWDRDRAGRLASHGGALFVNSSRITRIDPANGHMIYDLPEQPGEKPEEKPEVFFSGRTIVMKYVSAGTIAYGLTGGTEIWRAPDDCDYMSLQGGLHGRALETCGTGPAQVLILGNGHSERWSPSDMSGYDSIRCADSENLDGSSSPPSSRSSVETIDCLFGRSTQNDDTKLVLRGLSGHGRVMWERTSAGTFRDLTFLDPERVVLQTDQGMRLVRARDGKELGRFEDSAACRVLGVYARKLISKTIGAGWMKIHDLETRRLLETVGAKKNGPAYVGRGSPYVVLLDPEDACWRIYRLSESSSPSPMPLIGTIPVAIDE